MGEQKTGQSERQFGRQATAKVKHYRNTDDSDWETEVTIEHGIATRTYTTPGKLTEIEALEDYKNGRWVLDYTDPNNAGAYCIGILKREGWVKDSKPFRPQSKKIQDFPGDNGNFLDWEIQNQDSRAYAALVWAIENAGLHYEPVWYAAQVCRHFSGPPDAHFIGGYMFRELTMRYRHEDAAISHYTSVKARTSASGETSKRKRQQRIEALLTEMERVVKDNPDSRDFGASAVADVALKNVVKANSTLWSQGQNQLDNYLSEMKTDVDLRRRYLKIFPETAKAVLPI